MPSMPTPARPPKPTGPRSSSCTTNCVGLTPTPIIALNRAVAVAEVQGPAAALRLVETLPLVEMHLWHAIRADLLRRLGRAPEAAGAYAAAISRAGNARERAFLQRQCDGLRVSYRS